MGEPAVRDLDLGLDTFEGPFDLLLTLVLKDELELADVETADIVQAFAERHAGARTLDLAAWGEFLVVVASLLELKGRSLLPDEDPELELDPDEAAGELAERLALLRRVRAGADWLRERLEAESDRFFRLGPAPLAPAPAPALPAEEPARLAEALRRLAVPPPEPSLGHLVLTFPPVSRFLARFRALVSGRRRFLFDREVDGLTRIEQAVAFLALLELGRAGEVVISQPAPFAPIAVWSARSA